MGAMPGRARPPRGGGRSLWPAWLRRGRNRRLRSRRGGEGHSGRVVAPVAGGYSSSPPSGASASAGTPARTPPPPLRQRLAALLPALAMVIGAAAVGGALVGLHHVVTRSPHFALRAIRASGTVRLTADLVAARSGVAVGDNLFSFSLDAVARRLRRDPVVGPWIAQVRLHRELPSSLALEIVERRPVVSVELGALYLADSQGEVFKRATIDEVAELPVVTGIARDAYIHDRAGAQALLREAVGALAAWRSGPPRPPVGEIHVDPAAGTTLYLRARGTAIRVGRGDEKTLAARLARVDAVRAELARTGERPLLIHADAPLHAERVTVRLAAANPPATVTAAAAPAGPASAPTALAALPGALR